MPAARTGSRPLAGSEDALGAALEHVVGRIRLDHPDRVPLGRIDVDLERGVVRIEELHGAAAVVVDRVHPRCTHGRLHDRARVTERIGNRDNRRGQRAVTIEMEHFKNRLRHPGHAWQAVGRSREAAGGKDILAFQDTVIASFGGLRCRKHWQAHGCCDCDLPSKAIHVGAPKLTGSGTAGAIHRGATIEESRLEVVRAR